MLVSAFSGVATNAPYTPPMTAPSLDLELIYVGDPMCSWCWGFAPVLEQLDARYTIPLRTVVGGLRPGPSAEALDDDLRGFLAHHWEQVEEASGQPFDIGGLDRDGWVYDTELPCTAVVAMRNLNEKATLPFFARLQRAFYAERVDITDPAVYPALLEGFDVDAERFMGLLGSETIKAETWADFEYARKMSATGFPTLVVRDGEQFSVATRGFMPYERLEPTLTGWLAGRYGESADSLVCDIDAGAC